MRTRLLEALLPARLGTGFRWLFSSALVSNLGDGIVLAAGPLLVASQTRDPLLVAAAAVVQRLPWLLFGVFAGALVDRVDRRGVIVVVDLARAAVLTLLAAAIVTGAVSIGVVLAALFLLGTAETFADVSSQTLLPSTVPREHLGVGNARLQGVFITANQLVGPPIGAALFAAGMAWPFAANAVCFALGAVLISRLTLTRPGSERHPTTAGVRNDIREGVRWLWQHAAMRTLALTIVLFNVTFGAAYSVLVLYAGDRLSLGAFGFGLLATASAVGGLVGTSAFGWLERRLGYAWILRVGLVIETLTHLALALTTTAWVALLVLVVFGAHAFVWGTTADTIRQRAVPDRLLGRVTSVYMIGVVGGMVAGGGLGGVIARQWGVTAPFWFGFGGSALLLAVLWRELGHIAHVGEDGPVPDRGDPLPGPADPGLTAR